MKYQEKTVVSAIYDKVGSGGQVLNPFLEAMPELMDKGRFFEKIASLPPMPYDLAELSGEERRRHLPVLQSVYYPMDYMYNIYDTLYRAVTTTYTTRTTMESVRQLNAIHEDFRGDPGKRPFLCHPGGKRVHPRRAGDWEDLDHPAVPGPHTPGHYTYQIQREAVLRETDNPPGGGMPQRLFREDPGIQHH